MKRPAGQFSAFLGALAALVAAGVASAAGGPELGLLQFNVAHNLETQDCLAAQSCALHFEDFDDTAAWLARVRSYSDLAVLHWDRAIPWPIFDTDPPPGSARAEFYDPLLDTPTVAWIDAFASHFASMGRGYLAVSILSGERTGLAELHLGVDEQRQIAESCPDFSPGTQISFDLGEGVQSFDLERSYRNFVLYLAEKLRPDFLALIVEANLIETTCPSRAAGLYSLYRNLYDAVRLEVGPGVPLFATLTYPQLLAYDSAACYPTLDFELCGVQPAEPVPGAGEAACFPIDRTAIDALDQGGRLDVLALSFYPDGLEMNPVPGAAPETRAYSLDAWSSGGSCLARKRWPTPVDPLAALDRLGWQGPVAVAETSARA